MTIKNNPYRRLGRLLHNARNHQHLSLFETSQRTGIPVTKLIAIEEAQIKFYEEHPNQAIDAAQSYSQYLGVDAYDLIREVSLARNIKQPAIPIPAFLLKK
jgi:cytoskeletal protein RodZ